ncbi:hypothetical protein F5X98DRAFT_375929 [Xylaria grammica]|nr:hypothetical protein F5X98DRAFT_375929 [Xylaria grammica]
MTTPEALLGPILGATLGALGAAIAAVIGAVLAARLNRAGQRIDDIEFRNAPEQATHPPQQDRVQVDGSGRIHGHQRAHTR